MTKPKKKIIQILHHSSPDYSLKDKNDYQIPIDNWHSYLSRELKKQIDSEYSIECWSPEASISKQIDEDVSGIKFRIFPSIRIKKGFEISFSLLWNLFSTTRRNETIVEIHGIHYIFSYFLMLIGSIYGKVLAQHHGDTFTYNANNNLIIKCLKNILHNVEKVALSFCEVIFYLNKYEKSYLSRFSKNAKLYFSTMGVDTTLFKPIDQINCRNKLDINLSSNVVLFVARCSLGKGIIELIKAISDLKEKVPELKLIVIGDGYDKSDEITSLVKELKISDNLRFEGYVPNDQLPFYLNASNVFCLPSYREGFPVACLEALACNKEVVSTRVGGLPDFGNSFGMIKLVKPRDHYSLSVSLKEAINSNRTLDSRSIILRYFSWDVISKRRKNLYKMLYKNG